MNSRFAVFYNMALLTELFLGTIPFHRLQRRTRMMDGLSSIAQRRMDGWFMIPTPPGGRSETHHRLQDTSAKDRRINSRSYHESSELIRSLKNFFQPLRQGLERGGRVGTALFSRTRPNGNRTGG